MTAKQKERDTIHVYLAFWYAQLQGEIAHVMKIGSEDLVCDLLNIINSSKLKNYNKIKSNFPAIDLGDENKKIAVQITSVTRSRKIIDTLKSFLKESQLTEKFNRLYFVILDYKKPNVRDKEVLSKAKVFFTPDKDIYTFIELKNIIMNLYPGHKFDAVKKLLERELRINKLIKVKHKMKVKITWLQAIKFIDIFSIKADLFNKAICTDIEQIIKWDKSGPDTLFFDELINSPSEDIIIITAPPGGGKSTLLLKFQRYIKDKYRDDANFANPFLACTIDLGAVKKGEINLAVDQGKWAMKYLLNKLKIIYKDRNNEYNEDVNIFKAFFSLDRKIYLLVDALDEFHNGDIDLLLEICDILTKSTQIKIIITVRKYYWQNQINKTIKNRIRFVTTEIEPLTISQIVTFLDVRIEELPTDVLKKDKDGKIIGISNWISNPLILNFIKRLFSNKNKPVLFTNKTDIYDKIVNHLANWEKRRTNTILSEDKILILFSHIALVLSQERTRIIDRDVCEEAISIIEKAAEKATTEYQEKIDYITDFCLNSGFINTTNTGQNKEGRFCHATLLEYFLARMIFNDFKVILDMQISDVEIVDYQKKIEIIKKLALSQAQLDYVSESICGFLLEMFENKNKMNKKEVPSMILKKLIEFGTFFNKCFDEKILPGEDPEIDPKKPSIKKRFWELFRNLVEFIGYTYDENSDETEICNGLMQIIENTHYSQLVHYNAARALTRVHPLAPHPHYDVYSDWTQTDFKKSYFLCNRWVIAGGGSSRREPVNNHGITIMPEKKIRKVLQEDIFNRLINVLSDYDIAEEYFVAINCSQTLIYWYDNKNSDSMNKLDKMLEKADTIKVPIRKWNKDRKTDNEPKFLNVKIPLSKIVNQNIKSAQQLWKDCEDRDGFLQPNQDVMDKHKPND